MITDQSIVLNAKPHNCQVCEDCLVCHQCVMVKAKLSNSEFKHDFVILDANLVHQLLNQIDDTNNYVMVGPNNEIQNVPPTHKPLDNESDGITYTCIECNKVFNSVHDIELHLSNVHEGVVFYKCGECSQVFQQHFELAAHEHVPNQPKSCYACEFCDLPFTSATKLKIHMSGHTGEKPYKCTICGACFDQKKLQELHSLVHKLVVKCPFCPKRFETMDQFRKHNVIHGDTKSVFKCKLCDTTFSTKQYVKVHLQKIHNIEYIIEE